MQQTFCYRWLRFKIFKPYKKTDKINCRNSYSQLPISNSFILFTGKDDRDIIGGMETCEANYGKLYNGTSFGDSLTVIEEITNKAVSKQIKKLINVV